MSGRASHYIQNSDVFVVWPHSTVNPPMKGFAQNVLFFPRLLVLFNHNFYIFKVQDDVISIALLTHVAADQLVAIKGYVQYLGATKIIDSRLPTEKEGGYIVDPSGYIKIIFWGNQFSAMLR